MNNKDLQLSRPDRSWFRYLLLPCSRMSIHFTVQPFNTPARKSFRIAACSHKRTVILVQRAFCNKPKRSCATADRESRGIFNRMVPRKLTWVSEKFGLISKSQKRFGWVSESRIGRFFFPFGLQESIGIFQRFVATAYRTKLLD